MPWYSTTTNQQVAIHLQIKHGGAAAAAAAAASAAANMNVNNNGLSPAGLAEVLPGLPEEEEEEEEDEVGIKKEAVANCNGANSSLAKKKKAAVAAASSAAGRRSRFRLKKSVSVTSRPCIIITSETPLLEPTLARDALARATVERRLSWASGSRQQQQQQQQQQQEQQDISSPGERKGCAEGDLLSRLGLSRYEMLWHPTYSKYTACRYSTVDINHPLFYR